MEDAWREEHQGCRDPRFPVAPRLCRGGICIGSEEMKLESRRGRDLVTKRISPPPEGTEETGSDAGFSRGRQRRSGGFVRGSPPGTASPSQDREPLGAAVTVNDSIS